jgi:hypothetical protein
MLGLDGDPFQQILMSGSLLFMVDAEAWEVTHGDADVWQPTLLGRC